MHAPSGLVLWKNITSAVELWLMNGLAMAPRFTHPPVNTGGGIGTPAAAQDLM